MSTDKREEPVNQRIRNMGVSPMLATTRTRKNIGTQTILLEQAAGMGDTPMLQIDVQPTRNHANFFFPICAHLCPICG